MSLLRARVTCSIWLPERPKRAAFSKDPILCSTAKPKFSHPGASRPASGPTRRSVECCRELSAGPKSFSSRRVGASDCGPARISLLRSDGNFSPRCPTAPRDREPRRRAAGMSMCLFNTRHCGSAHWRPRSRRRHHNFGPRTRLCRVNDIPFSHGRGCLASNANLLGAGWPRLAAARSFFLCQAQLRHARFCDSGRAR